MRRSFTILLGLISTTSLYAQTNLVTGSSLDAYWNFPTTPTQTQATLKAGTALIPGATSSLNEIITQQQGTDNAAALSILAGSQNRLEVNQATGLNTVEAALSGSNNSILLNQTGTGNSIQFGLTGTSNSYMLTQDGGDRIQMQGLQQNNQRLDITQGSGANSLTIDNTPLFKDLGNGIPNLRIEQSGGATVTVQQGKVY